MTGLRAEHPSASGSEGCGADLARETHPVVALGAPGPERFWPRGPQAHLYWPYGPLAHNGSGPGSLWHITVLALGPSAHIGPGPVGPAHGGSGAGGSLSG